MSPFNSEELTFDIQEGTPQEWMRVVDTALPSPEDFSYSSAPLAQIKYEVAPIDRCTNAPTQEQQHVIPG